MRRNSEIIEWLALNEVEWRKTRNERKIIICKKTMECCNEINGGKEEEEERKGKVECIRNGRERERRRGREYLMWPRRKTEGRKGKERKWREY